MGLLDKKELSKRLEKAGLLDEIEDFEQVFEDFVKDKLSKAKNKKLEEQLTKADLFHEERLAKKLLSKEDLKKLPSWAKENLDEAFIVGKSGRMVQLPDGRKFHLDNPLNDLTGAEWSFFLRSVINTRYQTSGKESYAHKIRKIHPSPKPPQLMRDIIQFFSKENELVLDYFMGVGGTLIGASLCNRQALGIDLSKEYIGAYKAASKELNLPLQKTIKGDAMSVLRSGKQIERFLGKKLFSLIAIDPPYYNMMSKEKTGEYARRKQSVEATPFTEDRRDLGNVQEKEFYESLKESVVLSMQYLKNKGHVIVFIKDLQPKKKEVNLLHSRIVEELNEIPGLYYLGMKIWADESINLFPYGYPYSFVSNQLHQYILIFRKVD